MHHLFILFPCLLFSLTVAAQDVSPAQVKQQLINDPDITWLGETETNLRFHDDNPVRQSTKNWNRASMQKMLVLPSNHGMSEFGSDHQMDFQVMLLNWMNSAPAYRDRTLLTPFPLEEQRDVLNSYDTILIVEADGQERTSIVWYEQDPQDVLGIRVHQLVYWNQAEKNFGSRPLSFSLLIATYDEQGEFAAKTAGPWFPIEGIIKPQTAWKDDAIRYVIETWHSVTFAGPDKMPVLKGEAVKKDFFLANRDDKNARLRHVTINDELLNAEERADLFRDQVDTIMIINPATYETEYKVIDNPFPWDDLRQLRLVNRWFWDAHSWRLSHQFISWAPVLGHFNEIDQLLYVQPLFYRLER